ncbi:MAG: zinc ribbon domain-containing protein [Chloroflexi bacterium]|nr:zinc ribbon domain-containing protein [Chloroflexota bacterium]
MLYCRQCGTTNRNGNAFCESCGASMVAEEVFTFGSCQKCGATVGALDSFCGGCGALLSGDGAAAAQSQPEPILLFKEATPQPAEEEIDFGPLLLSDDEDDLPAWLQQYLDSTKTEDGEEPNWLGEFENLQKSIESSSFLTPEPDDEQQPVDIASWLEDMDLAEEVSALVESAHSIPHQVDNPETGIAQPAPEVEQPAELLAPKSQAESPDAREAFAEAAGLAAIGEVPAEAEPAGDAVELEAECAAEEPWLTLMEAAPEPASPEAAAEPEDYIVAFEAEEEVAAEPSSLTVKDESQPESGPAEIPVKPSVIEAEQAATASIAEVVKESEVSHRPPHLRLVKPEEAEQETPASPETAPVESIGPSKPQILETEISAGERDGKGPEEFRGLVLASSCLSLVVLPRLAVPVKARTDAGASFAEIGPTLRTEPVRAITSKSTGHPARTFTLITLVVLIVALLTMAYLVWFGVIQLGPLVIPASINGLVGALLSTGFLI